MKSPGRYRAIILCAVCAALMLLSCDKPRQDEPAPPPVKVEVVGLPSEGVVVSVSGQIYIKEQQSSGYVPVSPERVLNRGDEIELKRGASLSIRFTNGTVAVLEAETADRRLKIQ